MSSLQLLDPSLRCTVRTAELHESDYTPWEGHEVTAWPSLTVLRGKIMVEDGTFHAAEDDGRYLKRKIPREILEGSAI